MAATYKGWVITFDRYQPVTGRWRAQRYGVGMCNSSVEAIKRMVDRKNFEVTAPPT